MKPAVYRKVKIAAIIHGFVMPLLQHVFPWKNQRPVGSLGPHGRNHCCAST